MGDINLNIKGNVFLPAFKPYICDYSHRYEIYYGDRASGKTYFCVQKMLIKALKEKRFILLMNKQTNKLKDGVWRELKQSIDFFKLTPYFELNKTDFRATCRINGSEIRCIGLDEPEKIKGYSEVSDVYLDEMTAFSADDYELIDGTLRSMKYKLPLQMIGSFNPVSKVNWVYKYFGFETNEVPNNTLIHHSTYLDNPRADAAAYMENLKKRNPARYKIEALGEFATLDKLVFPYWKTGSYTKEETLKMTLMCGLDFGYVNDPTAFIVAYADDNNQILYIDDEFYEKGMLNDAIAGRIIAKGYGKEVIIADSAEPKSIEEIKRAGVIRIKPAVKGKDSINAGIQKIQQYDIVINPRCVNTITEFENYAWQKDKQTNEYTNKPIDTFNHLIDALRYAIQSKGKGSLGVGNISGLGI